MSAPPAFGMQQFQEESIGHIQPATSNVGSVHISGAGDVAAAARRTQLWCQ
jgi:hypothetical protein